jgi:hypothetical protein
MKKGEKVWVLCEVAGDSPCGAVLMKGPQGTPFWAHQKDFKPVEPESTVKQYLTGENQPANDSEYRDATPKDVASVVCGEKVKARFRDHNLDEWTKTDEWLGGYDSTEESKWIDDTGCPWKYCQVYDPEKPEPNAGLRLLFGSDIVEPGDFFKNSRDGYFHSCNFTIGMKVCDAVMRGEQQRETWTFYRPKVKA